MKTSCLWKFHGCTNRFLILGIAHCSNNLSVPVGPGSTSLPASLHHGDIVFTIFVKMLTKYQIPGSIAGVFLTPNLFIFQFLPEGPFFTLLFILLLSFPYSLHFPFFWHTHAFPDLELVFPSKLPFCIPRPFSQPSGVIRVTFLTRLWISFNRY